MTRHIKSVIVCILLLFSVGITHAQPTSDLLAMATDDHVAADALFVYATDKDKLIIDLTLSTTVEGVTMFRDASKVGDAMKDVSKISDVTSATYKQYKQLNGIKDLSNLMILGKDGKYFKWSDIKDELIVELGERYAKFCDDFIAIARNSNKHLDLISCDLPSGIRGDGAGSRSGKCNRRLVKAWKFAFGGALIRTNVNVLESISAALQRGAVNNLPTSSLNELTESTISHILRGNPVGHGNPTGGFHHITALIKRTDVKLIDVNPVGSHGCYKATVKFPNGNRPPKDFFPDSWEESKIISEIENAFGNMVEKPNWGSGQFRGTITEGVPIRISMRDGKISSAYPYYD